MTIKSFSNIQTVAGIEKSPERVESGTVSYNGMTWWDSLSGVPSAEAALPLFRRKIRNQKRGHTTY